MSLCPIDLVAHVRYVILFEIEALEPSISIRELSMQFRLYDRSSIQKINFGSRSSVVVEVLCYKLEGLGFETPRN
jgi:hypothetical protein